MAYDLLEHFLDYVRLNTRSDARSTTIPTTSEQVVFARILEEKLHQLSLSDIQYNEENGFLTAVLKGNPTKRAIGFIAHLDTADFSAENIQPQVHYDYDGKDVVLNAQEQLVMRTAEFPNLKEYKGQTLITTDGTTLLGADDKAGIVEIFSMLDHILAWDREKHGDIYVAFGPDEEIGRGADLFDPSVFPVEFAYTIDSGRLGHFEYETFNAAQAKLTIEGTSVHPGTAYHRLVNALKIAQQIDQALPQLEVPEYTREREGFYLLHDLVGSIGQAKMTYIIRDHDAGVFEQRKKSLSKIVEELNQTFDYERITLTIEDQYYNMREIIDQHPQSIEIALAAIKAVGLTPIVTPFRGGTDGSKISYLGIPTPNIFTGGENFHGQYEFITKEAMEKTVETLIKIVELAAE